MQHLSSARRNMIESHLRARGLKDPAVLQAMEEVPREEFLPDALAEFAYADSPLPIGEGQTISQPYIVAVMAELLELKPGDRVLDVGTGSGYAAAVLSRIAGEIHTIERHASLAAAAEKAFRRLGYANIRVHRGDGSLGVPEHAPYDAIAVTAGAPAVPDALRRQLAVGGRLVVPVGSSRAQDLVRVHRAGRDTFRREDHFGVRFVPLVGAEGWGHPAGAGISTSPSGLAKPARRRR